MLSRKEIQHLSDEALLDYYHSTRNLKAFRQLYARHKDSLYRYCSQMCAASAAGVLEELWRSLLERPPQLCGRLLRSWLFIRLNKLLRNCTDTDNREPAPALVDDTLLCGIQQLPRIQRNVLLLHLECELPLATVADIESISLAACRDHYHRGREHLDEILHGPKRQPWRIEEVEVTV
ncbi:sigma factor-like helix-turn-helix DNA-binding protein [Microbulbifer sp. SAOS-129_SWC]|uniref:RNA polymerase sigma factor n=1 Tax=Microbulbifer sp. SAOS-129_SWC TaxID=3145235 RepID=UPI003217DA84